MLSTASVSARVRLAIRGASHPRTDVTMYQRDSTYVMTTKEGMPRLVGRKLPPPLFTPTARPA